MDIVDCSKDTIYQIENGNLEYRCYSFIKFRSWPLIIWTKKICEKLILIIFKYMLPIIVQKKK